MKSTVSLIVFAFGLIVGGCTSDNRLERIQVEAPADADIVGTYYILEETASGKSLEKTELKATRVELAPGGTLTFTEFPLFNHPAGFPGIFTKINETGRWLITSDRRGYSVEFTRANGDHLRAVVTEGGNPSDLIFYYGPRESGYFTKLRKL